MNRRLYDAYERREYQYQSLHYRAGTPVSYYQEHYGYRLGDFPCAESISARIVSLPLFPLMTFDEQDRVIATMKKNI